jgi:hypothetical protein
MYRSRLFPLALCFTCCFPLAAQDGDKQQLRYSYEKGATGHYTVEQVADIDFKMGEQSMKQNLRMQLSASWVVTDVKDGTAHVSTEITRVAMDMKSPMGSQKFDTDDEDSLNAMFEPILDMIGKKIESQMDARGHLTVTKVPDEMARGGRMGPMLDAEGVLTPFHPELPEAAVAVGDTWEGTLPQAMGPMGSLDLKVVNKLVSMNGRSAVIEQKISLGESDDIPVKLDSAASKIVLNLGEAMPASAEMSMDMTLSQSGMDAGGGDGGSMKINQTSTLKRTEAPKKKDAEKTDAEGKDASAEQKKDDGGEDK